VFKLFVYLFVLFFLHCDGLFVFSFYYFHSSSCSSHVPGCVNLILSMLRVNEADRISLSAMRHHAWVNDGMALVVVGLNICRFVVCICIVYFYLSYLIVLRCLVSLYSVFASVGISFSDCALTCRIRWASAVLPG
jgi:hypothetical protein